MNPAILGPSYQSSLKALLGEGLSSPGGLEAAHWVDTPGLGEAEEVALLCASPLGALAGRLSAGQVHVELARRGGARDERLASQRYKEESGRCVGLLAEQVSEISARAIEKALRDRGASEAQASVAWAAYWRAFIDAAMEGGGLRELNEDPLRCARALGALGAAMGSVAERQAIAGLAEYGWQGLEARGYLKDFYWACLERCAELGAQCAIDPRRCEKLVSMDEIDHAMAEGLGVSLGERASVRLKRLNALIERSELGAGLRDPEVKNLVRRI